MRNERRAPRTSPRTSAEDSTQGGERLQKILARAGVASRRAAEDLIRAGRVTVNGQVVTEMGVRADAAGDDIRVNGRPISAPPVSSEAEELVYIMLHKPEGVVSTAKDTHGRPTVLDLLKGTKDEEPAPSFASSEPALSEAKGPSSGQALSRAKGQGTKGSASRSLALNTHRPSPRQRVYPVGRLDADSSGLLLLTNDGDLTFRLTHPRYGVEKEYRVLVRGRPNEETLRRLREGVEIEGGVTSPAKVEETGRRGSDTWLRVVIHEGRKRQVRLMTAAVGHPVIQLQRVRLGPLSLGDLAPGRWRYLARHEVHALRKAVKLSLDPSPKKGAERR